MAHMLILSDVDQREGYMADDRFLKQAYSLENQEDTQRLYQEWAASYDETVQAHGYISPSRCAEALARHIPDMTLPILDVGCGTGLAGMALASAGFQVIDGSDLSQEMLAQAAARDGVYRTLSLASLDNPFDFEVGTYAAIAAVGVLADKHAPPETVFAILDKLATGGLFVFSLNNHTLENPAYMGAVNQAVQQGLCHILEDAEGPHLTGYDMTSKVIVLKRL